ncbi:MAG: hypothetical protein ACSLEX_00805 [Minisyncoccota bacterium]
MLWMSVALAGYFLSAVTALLDKYLLSGPIKTPVVYAFFVSLFSLFTLVFLPFGFQFLGWLLIITFLLSGALFLYGLVAFYNAIQQWDISRIAPLVGTTVSLVAFLAIFLPGFSEDTFSWMPILALLFLIGGGLLVAFDLPFKLEKRMPFSALVAGVAMGVSLLILKYGYAQSNFVSGLIWSRLGIFLAGLSLLLIPHFRRQIFASIKKDPKLTQATSATGITKTSMVFVGNKTLAGIGSFLITYATFLGPVSFVQALSGTQYVFLLILTWPLCRLFPAIYCEKLFFWDWTQRIFAILLIVVGLWLASISGIVLSL